MSIEVGNIHKAQSVPYMEGCTLLLQSFCKTLYLGAWTNWNIKLGTKVKIIVGSVFQHNYNGCLFVLSVWLCLG